MRVSFVVGAYAPSAEMVKVLLLTKYGGLAASTRHRYLQYLPYLREAGVACDVSPLLDDRYLSAAFSGQKPLVPLLEALGRRAVAIVRAGRYDRIVLHCEAFPYLPRVFESSLHLRGIPYVYDFDDAIFHQYDCHPNPWVRWLFSEKIRAIIREASDVIAGNEYLAGYAREVNERVTLLPTAVDTQRYTVRPDEPVASQNRPLVVGWIGSPSTAPFVAQQRDALAAFCSDHHARVVLVGSGSITLPGVPVEIRPWREETEVRDIQEFDIGIMPLPDTPWTRGKSGFKLIQYMACGLPVIASPVGVNATIVDHGQGGFLASDHQEWRAALEALAVDPKLRARLGRHGRRKAEEHYSLRAIAPRLAAVLKGG
jgi:glycosyltransferase involved in cell wall biosynthesis